MRTPLLPPAVAAWPAVLLCAGLSARSLRRTLRGGPPPDAVPDARPGGPPDAVADWGALDEAAAVLARIRAEGLFWPAPRAGAPRPRALALDPAWLPAARAHAGDAEAALARDPAAVDPERLEAVFGPPSAALLWARIGGLGAAARPREAALPAPEAESLALLRAAEGRSPWTGAPLTLGEAVEAQALLLAAARRARGPVGLIGMSRWKRRGVARFLVGPDGPARRARRPVAGPVAVWGAGPAPAGALRVEDGFLRSVGLGLRHVPPMSLILSDAPLHFDATRPNGFEALVAAAEFGPALTARAAALRARVAALDLTKYNLAGGAAPPDPGGREAVLAPGQVEDDASIRLGARAVARNLDLLAETRRRFPQAFILYKPHPDVLHGRRPGLVPEREALRHADAVAADASAAACLAWADRIATMTSLAGFEGLIRGKAVTVFGRPFYAGWGLTDDVDPPPRPRRLTLDELVAAALILYPSYVDPATGLPAPPEIALEALARERAEAGRPGARLRRAWRDAISWVLTRL